MIQSAEAVTSNPVPVCVGATCTVTFEYSGDNYLWTPPANAASVSFDLQGAQGGVTGGKGGRVTGTFASLPTELYIFVGGVGQRGSSAAGGFNGGGSAGLGFGDEGSGGGATDIRTTSALSSRVVIAAGGGGSGGAIGGAGGSGGGLQGLAGKAARTEGGSGGTATVGGNGGLPYGGTSGTKGALGLGGNGGSSSYSGGGGGGGGLYGGGGGGATLDTCCYGSGAGGGAGGSSFASASLVPSPVHSVGVRAGSGLAIISYLLPPEVLTFASPTAITKQDTILFNLSFNQDVSGLASTDFTQPDNACSTVVVSGSASSYSVTLSGCLDGTHRLALSSNSVSGAGAGPSQPVNSNVVTLDSVSPTLVIAGPNSPSNAATPSFSITTSEPVSGFEAADLIVSGLGCSLDALTGSALSYVAKLKGCENASSAKISVSSNSVTDVAGNTGPAQKVDSATVEIDLAMPQATWAVTSSLPSYVNPSFEVSFGEPVVGLQVGDFEQIGEATNCSLALTEITAGTSFAIVTTGCGFGAVQLALVAGSFTDVSTNPGSASQSGSILFAAAPVVAPPQPTENPVAPTSEPTAQPSSAPLSDPVVETVVEVISAPSVEPISVPTATPVTEVFVESVLAEAVPVPRVKTATAIAAPDLVEAPMVVEPMAVESIEASPIAPQSMPAPANPIQTIQAVRTGSQSFDLPGLVYPTIGVLGAAAVALALLNAVKNLRLRRRVLPS